ncbi:hypothetical protein [Desulfosporosinus youngiae]|uniref:Uncharacterized protein n=1 Tax=Desulfosporosinus youngiae DSM 17734 TaxID=768710 RepID=H5Y0A3_9FIRM|nr:hypothetical protein [Desulfosporosinus youngiae]EHQ92082.1 hypothetical protein DesyoDRAFT_5150 [Desulfosporosinus youngiae DSM 17734]
MQTTANYGLKKPAGTDTVNIQDFNDNADVIDQKIKEVMDAAGAIGSHADAHRPGGSDPVSTAAPSGGLGTANAAGSSTSLARADHTHLAFDSTNPAANGTASAGFAATAARRDHVHPTDVTRAPLASPVFTGTPTAPTAVTATNNTQIATTAFVKAAVAALVDSAPAALDTLNEIAAALGDDPNFATTVTNLIETKADQTVVDAHLADVVYQVAGGTATALTLRLLH